jgi:hypothetical protein
MGQDVILEFLDILRWLNVLKIFSRSKLSALLKAKVDYLCQFALGHIRTSLNISSHWKIPYVLFFLGCQVAVPFKLNEKVGIEVKPVYHTHNCNSQVFIKLLFNLHRHFMLDKYFRIQFCRLLSCPSRICLGNLSFGLNYSEGDNWLMLQCGFLRSRLFLNKEHKQRSPVGDNLIFPFRRRL